jgi:hypothetical protein
MLLAQFTEGVTSFPVIGYIVWWNVRNVDLHQDDLSKMLEDCGLDTKYAREHNYRSAFIRAIRNMEEKRIIRKVDENKHVLVYQFTAEIKEGAGANASLDYDKETVIVIDKNVYRDTADFSKAIIEGREDIKTKVVQLFHHEKKRYRSSDITRYIQNILGDNADICALREQGNIYFVPAGYRPILDKVIQLFGAIQEACGASSSLRAIPMPNVAASKEAVHDSFSREIEGIFKNIETEIEKVGTGQKNAGTKWAENKKGKIQNIKDRIGLYADVLGERAESFSTDFDQLIDKIQPGRDLDI